MGLIDFDYVLISDLARWWVVLIASWTTVFLVRLFFTQWQQNGFRRDQPPPHPYMTLGFAMMMPLAILRRFEALGQPGNFFLWAVFVGVTFVLAGILTQYRIDWRPPWRRH